MGRRDYFLSGDVQHISWWTIGQLSERKMSFEEGKTP
jgi:hypothetical protein